MVFKSISEALTVPKIREKSARAKVNKKVLSEKIRFKVVVIEVPHKGVILVNFSIKPTSVIIFKTTRFNCSNKKIIYVMSLQINLSMNSNYCNEIKIWLG